MAGQCICVPAETLGERVFWAIFVVTAVMLAAKLLLALAVVMSVLWAMWQALTGKAGA